MIPAVFVEWSMAWRWLLVAGWLGAAPAAGAIPRLDLKPYPQPTAGEQRWVIQLPGVLPPSVDPTLSRNPDDWRVELTVGKEVKVDCNLHRFGGRLQSEPVKGWGYTVFRLVDPGPMVSTLMACPPGEPLGSRFVQAGSEPFLLPYNASLPVVVYTPKGFELRWRLWKAESGQRAAERR
jgi:ecotin